MNKLKLVVLGLVAGLAMLSTGAYAAEEVTVVVVEQQQVAASDVTAPSLPAPRRRPSVTPPTRR